MKEEAGRKILPKVDGTLDCLFAETRSLRVVFEARHSVGFPRYRGATFRGAFGYAYREISCALRRKECGDCLLRTHCAYPYVFETAPRPGAKVMPGYNRVPNPYVISPDIEDRRSSVKPGEEFSFDLVLIGQKARELLPYFVYALDRMGEAGIGKGKGKARVARIEAENDSGAYEVICRGGEGTIRTCSARRLREDPPAARRIVLRFQTPLRIKTQGGLCTRLDFSTLVRSLFRRAGLLSYFHCGGAPPWERDIRPLLDEAAAVSADTDEMRWHEWERYSTRQKTAMTFGGLMGRVVFEGEGLGAFLPLLRVGELVHAGKNTTFGLGRYVIEEVG